MNELRVTRPLRFAFLCNDSCKMAALKCEISVVKECCAQLGEGPHWDESSQRLIWVDIFGRSVHLLDPVTGKVGIIFKLHT